MQTKLQDIRDRLDKATIEPWRVDGNNEIIQTKHITRDVWYIPKTIEDIQFIANARQDIPFLLDALEQSQDRERVLRDAVNSLIGLCENVGDFSNGNTYNEIDEGNVMAERFIDHIKSNIKALEDRP